MREMLSSVCDIPGVTKDLIAKFSRKFPNFDTSLMYPRKSKKSSPGEVDRDQTQSMVSMLELVYKELQGKYLNLEFQIHSCWH